MKYIYKDGKYYFFKRKIPYTNKNYSFSLRTKNLKIAKLKTGFFLKESESLFFILKSMSRNEILDIYQQIDNILNEYKQRALIEYSKLEKTRQTDLKHSFYSEEHGKRITRDCSHPTVIEYWQDYFQDAIGDSSNQQKALFKQIFKQLIYLVIFMVNYLMMRKKYLKSNLSKQKKRFYKLIMKELYKEKINW